DRKAKEGKPGIVTIRTIALNQKNELVLQYDRKIMVAAAGKPSEASTVAGQPFPEQAEPSVEIPAAKGAYPSNLTGVRSYYENFNVGDVIVHANGRTITD